MTRKDIEAEKSFLETKNAELAKTIAEAQTSLHWNKKRIKLADEQLAAMPPEQNPGEAIEDISNGLS